MKHFHSTGSPLSRQKKSKRKQMTGFGFEEGESVLCFHGPMLYEAKVLKREHWKDKKDSPDGNYYFVYVCLSRLFA
jgi:hypothetical protein